MSAGEQAAARAGTPSGVLEVEEAWELLQTGRQAGKLTLVALPTAELPHALFDGATMSWIAGVGRHLGGAPAPRPITLLADQLAVLSANIFPAKDLLSGGCRELVGAQKFFAGHLLRGKNASKRDRRPSVYAVTGRRTTSRASPKAIEARLNHWASVRFRASGGLMRQNSTTNRANPDNIK